MGTNGRRWSDPVVFDLEASRVFTPSAPIDARALFAGRNQQIRDILDAVAQKGQHAIMFGERGVGKTSLANVLSLILQLPGSTSTTIKVNCDSTDSFETLWYKVFSKIDVVTTQSSIGFRIQSTQGSLPFSELVQSTVNPEEVRRQLHRLSQETLPIIILDEFDRLSQDVKRAISDTIKALSDEAIRATMILVGVADSVDELIEEHESISRALVQILMPRMSLAEIQKIIDNGLDVLQMGMEAGVLKRIQQLAQGLPHYAHLLGLHSVRAAFDRELETVDDESLDAAIRLSLNRAQQSIKTAYSSATSSSRPGALFADVLLACAVAKVDDLGFFTAPHVRDPLREITGKHYDIPSFSKHLNEFCDKKRGRIILKTGTRRRFRFRFRDPLMQPYVIMQGVVSGKLPSFSSEKPSA